jgi:hypothetical protein
MRPNKYDARLMTWELPPRGNRKFYLRQYLQTFFDSLHALLIAALPGHRWPPPPRPSSAATPNSPSISTPGSKQMMATFSFALQHFHLPRHDRVRRARRHRKRKWPACCILIPTRTASIHGFGDLQKLFEDAGVQEKKQVALNLANAIWAQQDHPFLPAFLDIARSDYAAKVRQVDFHTGAESARKDINDWVSGKTAGRIPDLIAPGVLNRSTRLVLVNAIYFKGNWLHQFKKRSTAPAPFTTAPGQTTPGRLHEPHRRASITPKPDGLQLLELPYAGGDLSMVVLLPRDPGGLKTLEDQLSADKLAGWLGQAGNQQVNVFLPKFKTTGQFELSQTLAAWA